MIYVPTLSNEPHRPQGYQAVVMKLLYHLGKLAGLVQRSYIPTGYSSLLFRFQGIRSRGVNSLQGLVDIRHLSNPLASVFPVTTNYCFSDVGFRNNINIFLQDGVVRPMHNPPLFSGLRTGWIYPDRVACKS